MRRLALSLLASSTLTAGLGQAALADERPVTPTYNWTGFYVGGHLGYRSSDPGFTANPFSYLRVPHNPPHPFNIPGRAEHFGLDGVIGGLQGGYNYQFAPNWLLGIEADISWGNYYDSHSFSMTDGFTIINLNRTSTLRLGTQGSVRGRAGYVDGASLFYVTGGVSFVQAKWSESWTSSPPLTPLFAFADSKTLAGWTLGGGVERMFAPNWLMRLEYLYADYGNFGVPLGLTSNVGNINITTHVVRIGVSYRFWP